MSDWVVALIFSMSCANSGVVRSFQLSTWRVLFSIIAWIVLIFEDIRLCMFDSFLLYTNSTLMTVMLARIRNDEMNRMVLILVLK